MSSCEKDNQQNYWKSCSEPRLNSAESVHGWLYASAVSSGWNVNDSLNIVIVRSGSVGLKKSQVYPPRYGAHVAAVHKEYTVGSPVFKCQYMNHFLSPHCSNLAGWAPWTKSASCGPLWGAQRASGECFAGGGESFCTCYIISNN